MPSRLAKLALILSFLAAISAFAALSFEVLGFQSALKDGIVEIRLNNFKPDGTMELTWDPNTCDSKGRCTELGTVPQVITPSVIRDDRPVDGSLILKLTDQMNLRVTSGMSRDHQIHYDILMTDGSGNTTRSIPLQPVVYTTH